MIAGRNRVKQVAPQKNPDVDERFATVHVLVVSSVTVYWLE